MSKLSVGTELLASFEEKDWIQAHVVYPEEISISRKIDRAYIRTLQPDIPATMVDYFFCHDEGRGEGGTDFDVT